MIFNPLLVARPKLNDDPSHALRDPLQFTCRVLCICLGLKGLK